MDLEFVMKTFSSIYSRKILSRAGLEPGISAPQLAILATTYRLCWAPTLAANRVKPNLTLAHARTALLAKFYKGIAVPVESVNYIY